MKTRESLDRCRESCGTPKKNAAGKIFETARNLFYQRGIRAVGVDEIVTEAGVTKPSLYRSFESKDELVAACLESYAEEGVAALEARLESAGPDPLARLRALVGHYAEKMSQPGFRGCPMSNATVEFPESGHLLREVAEDCKMEIRERISGLARQLAVEEPDALADGLMLLIEGAFSTHQIFGSQGPAAALVREANRLIDAHLKG